MKLLIDTEAKTVRIESDTNVGTLVDKLSKMFEDWKEFKIIPFTQIIAKEIKSPIDNPFTRKPYEQPYYNSDYFKVTSNVQIADDIKKGSLIEVDENGKEKIIA